MIHTLQFSFSIFHGNQDDLVLFTKKTIITWNSMVWARTLLVYCCITFQLYKIYFFLSFIMYKFNFYNCILLNRVNIWAVNYTAFYHFIFFCELPSHTLYASIRDHTACMRGWWKRISTNSEMSSPPAKVAHEASKTHTADCKRGKLHCGRVMDVSSAQKTRVELHCTCCS